MIDTGATNHMTVVSNCLTNVKNKHNGTGDYCIKLPNGSQDPITHIGDVKLCNDLILKDTVVVPDFKYNFLSVNRLCKDNDCIAIFHDEVCLIQDCATKKLTGIGEPRGGLYYLVSSPMKQVP